MHRRGGTALAFIFPEIRNPIFDKTGLHRDCLLHSFSHSLPDYFSYRDRAASLCWVHVREHYFRARSWLFAGCAKFLTGTFGTYHLRLLRYEITKSLTRILLLNELINLTSNV